MISSRSNKLICQAMPASTNTQPQVQQRSREAGEPMPLLSATIRVPRTIAVIPVSHTILSGSQFGLLFVSQSFDRIEAGSLSGRIKTEKYSHSNGEGYRDENR